MRLLLTTDCVGGVFEYTASLARRFASDGHTVLVAIVGTPSEAQLELIPRGVQVEARPYRLEWMSDPGQDLEAAADWLRDLGGCWAADVLHMNQLVYTGLVGFAQPVVVVVHSDVRSWFSEVAGEEQATGWDRYTNLVRSGLAGATAVVACTHYQAELTRRHFGRRVDLVIPNGADVPVVFPEGPRRRLVITAGRAWDQAKGVALLDQALELLGSGAPEAHHFGSLRSPEGEYLSLGHITAHGVRPAAEVHHWMGRAAVYAAPSLYEPFGLAPLEAALRGCALVLSDIGSFRELWDGCAEFCDPRSPRSLADAISRVLSNETHRLALAARAAERAAASYMTDRMAEGYLALYRSLLAGKDPELPREPGRAHAGPGLPTALPSSR